MLSILYCNNIMYAKKKICEILVTNWETRREDQRPNVVSDSYKCLKNFPQVKENRKDFLTGEFNILWHLVNILY